jgi:small subunit ribosomal protein S4
VHRLGFAPNRNSARQLVAHGHILLNDRMCNIPSMLVKAGDKITAKSRPRTQTLVKLSLQAQPLPVPEYLERTGVEPPEGRMTRLPTRGDVDPRIAEIQENLIIEIAAR